MNVALHILQSPSLMASMFAGHLPAVAIFFGITHLVLRKYIKVEIRPWLALAYIVLPILVLTFSAWNIRVKGHGDGVMLLGPLVLSIVSCCGLFYQEWRRQRNHSLKQATTHGPAIDLRDAQQPESVADIPNKGGALVNWAPPGLGLAIAGAAVLWGLGWPGISGIWNKPNYIVEDAGEYGYKQLDERATGQSVRVFRYAGVHNGKHQVYEQDSTGSIEHAYECAAPCKAIKSLSYFRVGNYASQKGSYRSIFESGGFFVARFIAADVDSVEARVMEDAINGHLKVQPLKSAALRLYRVPIETGMDGVPIRPVFSEEGIAFEYMAEAPAAKPGALPAAKQSINEERLDISKSPADKELPNRKAESKKSIVAQPTSSSTETAAKPVERSITSKESEEAKLTATHPDWRALISTSEFLYWRDNVISDGKALMESEDSKYIARRLSQFKRWRLEQNR
jgi:hypothetical protein